MNTLQIKKKSSDNFSAVDYCFYRISPWLLALVSSWADQIDLLVTARSSVPVFRCGGNRSTTLLCWSTNEIFPLTWPIKVNETNTGLVKDIAFTWVIECVSLD